jgi:DNA invertase Pin-like site-specific DNA recombinase
MNPDTSQKVTASHLQRDAYLYVRQSTVRQVFENTESTQRQYGLRQRAVALGWPLDRVIVIDTDLGQSGASAVDRVGFQRLVADVGMGRAGIVPSSSRTSPCSSSARSRRMSGFAAARRRPSRSPVP